MTLDERIEALVRTQEAAAAAAAAAAARQDGFEERQRQFELRQQQLEEYQQQSVLRQQEFEERQRQFEERHRKFDADMEKLKDRTDAVAQSVELLAGMQRKTEKELRHVGRLIRIIILDHEQRPQRLEGEPEDGDDEEEKD